MAPNVQRGVMRRRLWLLVIAIPMLLLIGDVAYWRYAVRQLQTGLHTWLAERRVAGWTTTMGETSSGGWPYAAILTISGLTLQGGNPDIPGDLRWSSGRIDLRLDLWRPTTLDVAFHGTQHLQFGGSADIPWAAEQLQATLPLRFGEPPRAIDIVSHNLRTELPSDAGTSTDLALGLVQIHGELAPTANHDNAAVQFSISAEAIGLPRTVEWPLGATLSSFTLDGTLNGRLPSLGRGLTPAVSEWRDGGGALDVRHLTLGWGPLGLTASATLALDDQLQPMGSGTGHIVGYAASLNALANGGVLSHSAATAATAVLSLLAGAPDANGASEVDVPLTLQYRTLSMRQIPLIRLPELDWPAP
jgi:hypothetical protein